MKQFFVVVFFVTSLPLMAFDNQSLLENCLINCYSVDSATANSIVEKLAPLFENAENSHLIQTFIEESEKISLLKPQGREMAETPPYHTVLFESDKVRISLGND